jgi:hypothetical protein
VRRDDAGGDAPAADAVNGASLLQTGRDSGRRQPRRKAYAPSALPAQRGCHAVILPFLILPRSENTGPATLSEHGKSCLHARREGTAPLSAVCSAGRNALPRLPAPPNFRFEQEV